MASQLKTCSISVNSPAHPRTSFRWLLLLSMFALLCLSCLTANAQQRPKFEASPVDPDYKMASEAPILKKDAQGNFYFEPRDEADKKAIYSRNRNAKQKVSEDENTVEAILESGSGSIDDPVVKKLMNGYVFAEMTQFSEDRIANLGEMRTEFLKDYLGRQVTGGRRVQFINSVAIPALQKIITGRDLTENANRNYHPAVRLNAVYLLGLLDSQAVDRLANPRKDPIPSATALDQLIAIYESEDAAKFPPYVKVAALAGIQRHVEINGVIPGQITDANLRKIATQATGLLTAANPEGQSESDAQLTYWLKRRSMQMLGLLKNANALDTILGVMQSDESNRWLKYDALEAIGALDLSATPAEKVAEVSIAITDLLSQPIFRRSSIVGRSCQATGLQQHVVSGPRSRTDRNAIRWPRYYPGRWLGWRRCARWWPRRHDGWTWRHDGWTRWHDGWTRRPGRWIRRRPWWGIGRRWTGWQRGDRRRKRADRTTELPAQFITAKHQSVCLHREGDFRFRESRPCSTGRPTDQRLHQRRRRRTEHDPRRCQCRNHRPRCTGS